MEIAKLTPSLGMVSIWWSRACDSIAQIHNTSMSRFTTRDGVGGEVAEARNKLVCDVKEYIADTGADVRKLFWLDDDVISLRGMVLAQLFMYNLPIVSGVYFSKAPGKASNPLIYRERLAGPDWFDPNKTYHVWGHGMGLCLIDMEVYRRMETELDLGKDKYGQPRWYHTSGAADIVENPNGMIHTGGTEDLYFLDNAAKLGYSPLVDTSKHAFGFHYQCWWGCTNPKCDLASKYWRPNCPKCGWPLKFDEIGYPTEQWNQWKNEQPIRWQTPEGEVVWD